MNKLPNFLIIGAAKSGTTSLYHYLNQHPQIFMCPTKETNFFSLIDNKLVIKNGTISKEYANGFIYSLEDYKNLFNSCNGEPAIGEASPSYLYLRSSAYSIKKTLPNVKLIIILRNPVNRAFSHFLHHRRANLETTTDFRNALEFEKKRMRENWWWGFYYVDAGLYCKQVKRYWDIFNRNQILMLKYEEFKNNQLKVLEDIYKFLDIDPDFIPDMKKKYNATYIYKSDFISKLLGFNYLKKYKTKNILPKSWKGLIKNTLSSYNKTYNTWRPELDKTLRDELTLKFKPDIMNLEQLVGEDFSSWYTGVV